MEIVKQYLEKRIEQLTKMLADEEEMYYARGVNGQIALTNMKKELEQVLTLFNEEYEKIDKRLNDHFDNVKLLHELIMPKKAE